ncbi:Aldo/keto reductase [Trametes versicolor FP-101664 SS1]|uniref:Aldo/keto reductase n=1 Tax=Trametes versicolor (strain FP-101664) TaxID=717944 RepID=R7S7P3_TRAVS|nr:Aldo/keto reductase [Trametes versicolor FP-101664 SS1]EIW51647.1 Aldo/keto reductase [Trametes versicolor FP-101664 SS1]
MSSMSRKIGGSQVSAIGFGAMSVAGLYSQALSDEDKMNLLDAVHANGCNFWDTADAYGDSEVVLGKWFKRTGKRDDVFLATKFGAAAGIPGRMVCGDPEYVPKAIDKSLERLGVDYIDLWYLHRADSTVPIELTVGAMAEQVKAGKVKYLGLSEISAATLRRAHAVHPIAAVQVEYSPFTLDIEDEKIGLLKAARELGVAVVAYSPLGRGLLTGRFRSPDDLPKDDPRHIFPRFSAENFPNILKVVDGVQAIATKYGATPGQVTLAWLRAQGDDIIPIPGTTRIANLKENTESLKVQLSQDDVDEIRKLAVAADKTLAPRYPAKWLALLYADTPALA